uniref:Uncharacterized protein n=1 Tax=Kalanchoe fedtschenkoi TaxID=63787 RepID=A0A7N0T2V5_KALFE
MARKGDEVEVVAEVCCESDLRLQQWISEFFLLDLASSNWICLIFVTHIFSGCKLLDGYS